MQLTCLKKGVQQAGSRVQEGASEQQGARRVRAIAAAIKCVNMWKALRTVPCLWRVSRKCQPLLYCWLF